MKAPEDAAVLLAEVTRVAAAAAAAHRRAAEAMARRDDAIRAAFAVGVNRNDIAAAADMRRERVYQIINDR